MSQVTWVLSYLFRSSLCAEILKIVPDLTQLHKVQWWELLLRHSVVADAFFLTPLLITYVNQSTLYSINGSDFLDGKKLITCDSINLWLHCRPA